MNAVIIGLDPSTVATGWAVIAMEGGRESLIASGIYEPIKGSLDDKLLEAFYWLTGLGEVYEDVTHLAIETPFFKLNARTMHVLSSLGAAFRLAATKAGIPVIEIAPAERGPAVGQGGNASKDQVRYMVNAIYNRQLVDHNESDAIAIAAAAGIKLRYGET